MKASFILDGEPNGNDELLELDLVNPDQYSKYQHVLTAPQRITFARYDVTSPIAQYSFTTENPGLLTKGATETELTVRLFRPARYSPELLTWVMNHHALSAQLQDEIDLTDMQNTLSELGERNNTPGVLEFAEETVQTNRAVSRRQLIASSLFVASGGSLIYKGVIDRDGTLQYIGGSLALIGGMGFLARIIKPKG